MNSTSRLGLVLLLLGAAFLVRFYDLSAESVWLDEAYTYVFSQGSYKEVYWAARADVHPPLYYFTVKPFLDLLGPEAGLRVSAALAGFFAAALILLGSWRLLSFHTATVATALYVLATFHVFYARSMRAKRACTVY